MCMDTIGNRALERNRFCASCGASFTPLRSTAQFCGDRCRKRASRDTPRANSEAASALVSVTGHAGLQNQGRAVSVTLNPCIVADERWPGMYRLRLADGSLSDMVNLTRARDALASIETARRPAMGPAS
jgi:hypothetical protein